MGIAAQAAVAIDNAQASIARSERRRRGLAAIINYSPATIF